MRVALNEKGRPIIVGDDGKTIGEVRSITFPTVTIQTPMGDVHELDRSGSVMGDVVLTNGKEIRNAELPIG